MEGASLRDERREKIDGTRRDRENVMGRERERERGGGLRECDYIRHQRFVNI